MKKIALIIVILLILSTGVIAQSTLTLTSPSQRYGSTYFNQDAQLAVELLRYEPVPAEPGDIVDLWIEVENIGGSRAGDAYIEIVPTFPFYEVSSRDGSREIGTLEGGQIYVAKLRVRIDKTADEGTNILQVKYSPNKLYGGWIYENLLIDIKTGDASVTVQKVKTIPEKIEPGSSSDVSIIIENIADSLVRDVTVSLDLSDLPLVPIDSSGEKKTREIQAGMSNEFKFTLAAKPDADADIYSVPVKITFNDETGTSNTILDVVGLIISSVPDLVITVDSTEVYKDNKLGDIDFRFVNKGFNEIKFVNVKLLESEDYTIISPSNEQYVGNIDSDDYETATFMIKINTKKQFSFPMLLEYRDGTNNFYTKKVGVLFTPISSKEAGIKNGSLGKTIFLLIIFGGIGYWIWKWDKKRKEKLNKKTK